jgi:dTDP-4-amino-4,6-dideoxygalactose transaminase
VPVQPASPGANYRAHRDELLAAVTRALDSGSYILGPEVASFEQELAVYLGSGHVIGVASGTDALELALRTLGIGPGDSVLTVSHTAVATVAAIEMAGARAVLVDIEDEGMTMSPGSLEATVLALQPQHRFRAVMPVHLYGRPADMSAILAIARRFDLRVIEDAAQAHGAELAGRRAGTLGDIGAFSFYPTKNLGGLGDGGALSTNDATLTPRARALREYGWRSRYVSAEPGINSRLDELQAAILRVKLRYLDKENLRRRRIAATYDDRLAKTAYRLPAAAPDTSHVYHQYVIRSPDRDALRARLAERGVNTLIHYPLAVHQQPAYADRLATAPSGLPVTEAVCREILSIPVQPELTDEEVNVVCDALLAANREV